MIDVLANKQARRIFAPVVPGIAVVQCNVHCTLQIVLLPK